MGLNTDYRAPCYPSLMLRRAWPYLILLALPMLPLWRVMFRGEAIGSFDQIRFMEPWHIEELLDRDYPEQPWDALQADSVLQFYPWRDLVLKSWGRGQLPAWNPYQLAGTPLLANSQSAALYPPHILLGIAQVRTTSAMSILAWLHLAWAGLGAFFLARKLGASEIGGVVAGGSFSLSAFMLSWASLPSVITTCSWMPWCLGFAYSVIAGDRWLRPSLGLAACVAMSVLSGHLQFLAYTLMACSILLAGTAIAQWLAARKSETLPKANWKGLGVGFLAIGAGLLMAGPHLFPVLQYSQNSHRKTVPTEDGYAAYAGSAIRLWELNGLVYPKFNGDPVQSVAPDVSSYWPQYVKPSANFAESAIGLGPLVVALLLCARRRSEDWIKLAPLTVVGLIAFLLAIGTVLGRVLYYLVPGWSSTGSPGRVSVVFVLVCCVLAGVVASRDVDERERKRKTYAPVLAFVVLSIGSLYAAMFGLVDMQPAVRSLGVDTLTAWIRSALAGTRVEMLAAMGLTAGFVAAWLATGRKRALLLLVPMIATPLLTLPNLIRSSSNTDLRLNGPRDERVALINGPWDTISRADAQAPPNLASLGFIHDLGGYDSLIDKGTVELLRGIDGEDPAAAANGNMMFVRKGFDAKKLAEAGVTAVWSLKPRPDLGKAKAHPQGMYVYELDGPGRITSPVGKAEVEQESLQFLHLKATGPGTLTVRDRNLPGWIAKVDGIATPISGDPWMEIPLPPGDHKVELNYVPPGLMAGLYLALPLWIMWAFGLVKTRGSVQ